MMQYDVIYLQDGSDPKLYAEIEVTWCSDRVNDDDTKYVKADKLVECQERLDKEVTLCNKVLSRVAKVEEERDVLVNALSRIMACHFVIDEVRDKEAVRDPEAPEQPGGLLYIHSIEIMDEATIALAAVKEKK